MRLSLVQDQAIAARMAVIVGADNFDRLFRGIQFHEFDGKVLYVYAEIASGRGRGEIRWYIRLEAG
ncbi:MAG: hypothetical protein JWQ07_5952 [Ramlibacter sp.]|nr:hypothetical protein [Ramlibacter sp.]